MYNRVGRYTPYRWPVYGVATWCKTTLAAACWPVTRDLYHAGAPRHTRTVACIHDAARRGDALGVQAELQKGVSPDLLDEDSYTASMYAASEGHVAVVAALVGGGATVGWADQYGYTALHSAAANGHQAVVELLLAKGAAVNKVDGQGVTALWGAAREGHTEIVKLLRETHHADHPTLAPTSGRHSGVTPAQAALQYKHPMCVALCDQALADTEGDKLKRQFVEAAIVHVISTRFRTAKGWDQFPADWAAVRPEWAPAGRGQPLAGEQTCDPNSMASNVKQVLEEQLTDAKVFNPNYDNAFLMRGNSEEANSIWLLNFRNVGLENARRTGGACIQVVTPPGLSQMQIAEADMAKDKGVRVVRLDCREVSYAKAKATLMAMPAFNALLDAPAREPALTRDELLQGMLRLLEPDAPERAKIEAELHDAATTQAMID
eukprot:COSAG01_NODE_14638_length_1428_cov_1.483822_1_plen_433_part_01